MRELITATALLVALGCSVAVAQNSARNGGSTSGMAPPTSTSGLPAAPVGHRQPRVGDVPSEKGSANLDAEDAALDRKIKSICRGC
jgi:hypothetical protein